jgi:hypothetical protein
MGTRIMTSRRQASSLILLLATALASTNALADGGWYLGGSTGLAWVELDVPGNDGEVFGFDESEAAWKVFGGYIVDLPLVDLGVEAGYVDFGSPSTRLNIYRAEADITGANLWGVAGIDVGPVGLFGKLGAIAWDLDGRIIGPFSGGIDESGTDLGLGIGAKFMLLSLEFRAEYEHYEIEDGIDMVSVGVNWVF